MIQTIDPIAKRIPKERWAEHPAKNLKEDGDEWEAADRPFSREREREITCEAIGKRWLTGKIDSRRALRVAYSSWSPPLGLSIQIWIRHTQSSGRWDRNKNTQKEDQTPSTRERERERERESLISYDILFSFPLGISYSILLHFTVMIQPTGMPAGSLHYSSYHYCHYIQKYWKSTESKWAQLLLFNSLIENSLIICTKKFELKYSLNMH